MAIQGSYNLDNALSSQAYAYKCWYNYNYGNNTMQISAKDMGEITQTWSGELSNWRATASNDENAYEIADDDFSKAYDSGKDTAKDKTGYEGGKGGMGTRNFVTTAAGVAGFVTTSAPTIGKAVGNAISKVSAKITGKAAAKEGVKEVAKEASKEAAKEAGKEAGKEAATEGTKEATKESTKKAGTSAWITAGIAIATTTAYYVKKPNKEQKEACDALQDEMRNSQDSLTAAQGDMQTYSDEVIELSDEAAVYNEDANENVEENKAEYDMYRASYDALMAKVEAGETLSEDEKALLKELVPLMQELGVAIEETSTDTTDAVSEIYDEMGTYQEGYDNAAATMAEVQGVTDYAESFDEATRTNCYVSAASQILNAANGATSGAKLCATAGFNIGQWIMGGAAIAAGVTSAAAAAPEQMKWAGEVGTEIDMRRATQDFNAQTTEIYDESIDGYEGTMGTVEDMTMAIPEDIEEMTEEMEIPEEAPQVPTEGGTTAGAGTMGLGLGASSGENGNGTSRTGLGLGTAQDGKDDKDKDKPVV